jgi:RimJ/RimL family protein N-acetyltransferase
MKSLEWASFVGIKLIRLTVSSQNLIATHVFEKCGFEYVKMDENNMLMSICLS